jgi:hypothetical protein
MSESVFVFISPNQVIKYPTSHRPLLYSKGGLSQMSQVRNQCLSILALAIVLKLLPHLYQRYDTVGDWRWDGDTLQITVSREVGAKNPDFVTLVFVHETIEAILCWRARR